jgi:ferredoxin--NADP+ reductase
MQTFKAKEPHAGKVISVKRIVGAQATGETCSIVIDHFGQMPYWEGQSYGVIPPGTYAFLLVLVSSLYAAFFLRNALFLTGINAKNGKPHTNRLYSISSTRYGDDMKVLSRRHYIALLQILELIVHVI